MVKHIPNAITLFRIILIPIFVGVYYAPIEQAYLMAVALFMFAGLSDGMDGYLARRFKVTSDFGQFLDPLADKLIVAAAAIIVAVTYQHWLYSAAAILIIGRDTYISGLREWAMHHNVSGAVKVSWWGKAKTALQFMALTFLLYGDYLYVLDLKLIGDVFLALATLLSLYSMILYSYNLYNALQHE